MIDKITLKFALVGIVNTVVGTVIMFVLYNFIGLGYWVSSAFNYIVGSILGFVLNKIFTFKNTNTNPRQIITYIINIALCYLLAYAIAKPFIYYVLSGFGDTVKDNFAMVVGMCIYTVLNYIGQRYFVFINNKDKIN